MASKSILWLALIGLIVFPGCSQPVHLHEGAPLADDQIATILGGGFPNLRSVDDQAVAPEPIAGKPDTLTAAGPHTLVIDYQPCSNANSCGLTSVAADVVLAPGRSYQIRHLKDGCTLWVAVTSFTRIHATPCRNYLWIEDHSTGQPIWGIVPVDRSGPGGEGEAGPLSESPI